MVEYTYLELILFALFITALAFALKYREEAESAKRFVTAMLKNDDLYKKVKHDHDKFMKEVENAN